MQSLHKNLERINGESQDPRTLATLRGSTQLRHGRLRQDPRRSYLPPLEYYPLSTGSRREEIAVKADDGRESKVQLFPKAEHRAAMEAAKKAHPGGLIVIDYTAPAAVWDNVCLYTDIGVPFVLGTTGFPGKPEELHALVEKAGLPAVIAPNMNKQIVLCGE